MSVNALPSQGIELQIGAGSPLTYSTIKEINSFSGPGGAGQIIDTTDLSSKAVEKIMGLPDEGQLTFEINYLPQDDQHISLRELRAEQKKGLFKLIFTDTPATTWSFQGFITGFTVSGGVNAPVRASVTIEITGEITES